MVTLRPAGILPRCPRPRLCPPLRPVPQLLRRQVPSSFLRRTYGTRPNRRPGADFQLDAVLQVVFPGLVTESLAPDTLPRKRSRATTVTSDLHVGNVDTILPLKLRKLAPILRHRRSLVVEVNFATSVADATDAEQRARHRSKLKQ